MGHPRLDRHDRNQIWMWDQPVWGLHRPHRRSGGAELPVFGGGGGAEKPLATLLSPAGGAPRLETEVGGVASTSQLGRRTQTMLSALSCELVSVFTSGGAPGT